MKMARKLYSMIEKDGQNFKRKALLCITFLLLLSRVQASYLMRKWEECLSQVNLQLPIREMNVYNTGTQQKPRITRVFRDEEWPEPEDHINEENQIALSLPHDQEGLEEQELDALVTSLV